MIQIDSVIIWVIVCLLLAVEHWFQWPSRLHRLVAYIIGTLTLNIPLSIWVILVQPEPVTVVMTLWGNIALGGATVLAAWGYDALMNNYRRRQAAEKELDGAIQ
jgi:hypothetical protein